MLLLPISLHHFLLPHERYGRMLNRIEILFLGKGCFYIFTNLTDTHQQSEFTTFSWVAIGLDCFPRLLMRTYFEIRFEFVS